ncbi:MAG TPA: hypothetical protein VMT63_04690 [Bacteroidales bacterium]|nr:hypothetical protein [Bacteroidales bacterium]
MSATAIVRRPGKNFAAGITTSDLGNPDYKKVLSQHKAYCNALADCGLELVILEADERYPDGCFVEDTAVVFGEAAVITRPGAVSRRGEEAVIEKVLSEYRRIERIVGPGTLDGGDILRADNHFYTGRSGRTNAEGARQFSEIVRKYGYTSSEIVVDEGLHLKSGLEYLGSDTFIATKEFSGKVGASKVLVLEPGENYSANCLLVNGTLIIPGGYPGSKDQLLRLGYGIIELDMSEFCKMDGGLTCLSLVF